MDKKQKTQLNKPKFGGVGGDNTSVPFNRFNKPNFKGPAGNFNTAFRTQNKGGK